MVFRLDPQMPVGSYKTYQVKQPKTAQTRIASCEAADCEAYLNGWVTRIDESTDLGGRQAHYIRTRSERKYTVTKINGITEFTFEPGQRCFGEHHVLDRPQFYLVRDGDWRGNPSGKQRMHTRGEYWIEDFAEHQDRLKTEIERG